MLYRIIHPTTHPISFFLALSAFVLFLCPLPLMAQLEFAPAAAVEENDKNSSYFVSGSIRQLDVSRHWSIVVNIKPRSPSGKDGTASIQLVDENGNVVSAFTGILSSFIGLAIGIKGPRRDIPWGDTPFGVYKYVKAAGGTEDSRLEPGFGTGKLYLDDNDMYGDVATAGRSLIRLHGGGSALANPYTLDQALLRTQGCVRMKNRDVNSLIQKIKGLPKENSVEYVFMGDNTYLRSLAENANLSSNRWWRVLRTTLQPNSVTAVTSVMARQQVKRAARAEAANTAPQQVERAARAMEDLTVPDSLDSPLIELVKLFAEDIGERGQNALQQLQTRQDSLLQLQSNLPQYDALQPQLAFALCYLGHDCPANRQVLEAALLKTSPYKGFYADEAQELISRLIDKRVAEGNEPETQELMTSLINVAPQADGALSEGLGITLSKKLRDNTRLFLSAFTQNFSTTQIGTSSSIRSRVYQLIRMANYLKAREVLRIRHAFSLLRNYSRASKEAVKEFNQSYFQIWQRQRSPRN